MVRIHGNQNDHQRLENYEGPKATLERKLLQSLRVTNPEEKHSLALKRALLKEEVPIASMSQRFSGAKHRIAREVIEQYSLLN